MLGIGIVTNPHSKLNKRHPERSEILSYIVGEQGVVAKTKNFDDLRKVARQFKDKQIAILAINGGDGTISRTLSIFIEEYGQTELPKIALLRGGTMNVVANNLGIKGSPEYLLFKLVDGYGAGKTFTEQKLTTLQVEKNFGFLLGTGVAAQFLKLYYQNKSNSFGAFLLVVKLYFSIFFARKFFHKHVVSHTLNFKIPKKEFIQKTVAVFVSTVSKTPFGFKMFPLVSDNLKYFHVVSFGFKPLELFWKIFLVLLKNGDQQDFFGKKSFKSVSLKLSDLNQLPIVYTIDGELFEAKDELKVELGPIISFIT